jgi:hypothetical protein
MSGGEPAGFAAFFYLGTRVLFVKVGERSPRPQTIYIEC